MKNLERADAEKFKLKLPRHNQQPLITTVFKTYLIRPYATVKRS